MKRQKEPRRGIRRPRWMRLVMLGLLGGVQMALLAVLLVVSTIPQQYDIAPNQVAAQNIQAPRDVEDTVSTRLERQLAREREPERYIAQEDLAERVCGNVAMAFSRLEQAQRLLAEWYRDNPTADSPPDAFWTEYQKRLGDAGWRESPALWQAVRSLTVAEARALAEDTGRLIAAQMQDGVREGETEAALQSLWASLCMPPYNHSLDNAQVAMFIVRENLIPNYVVDTAATQSARDRAEEGVSPVMYHRDQIIVREGELVTDAQYEVLASLGLLTGTTDRLVWLGLVLFAVVLCALGITYIHLFEPKMLQRVMPSMLLVCIVTTACLGVYALARWTDALARWTDTLSLLPLPLLGVGVGVLFIATLLHTRMALVYGVLLSLAAGVIVTGRQGLFTVDFCRFVLCGIAFSMTGVYVLNRRIRRAQMTLCGVCMGLAAGGMYAVVGMMSGLDTRGILIGVVVALAAGMFASVIVLGTLPLWEFIFDALTPMKLTDLAAPDRPLLRRLVNEAPGTYAHSVAVANLAERACEAIEADGALARVGAYYHDIGKLNNPAAFVENQAPGKNSHEALTPTQSAKIICAHVQDGVTLGRRARLPRVILDIIQQHHGDSLAHYFYHAEQQRAQAEGREALAEDFRYNGPCPQTREAAVVMLADTVEAAVRSLQQAGLPGGKPGREQIEILVRQVVTDKERSGQLENGLLSGKQLETVIQSFLGALWGQYHQRVIYPQKMYPQETPA